MNPRQRLLSLGSFAIVLVAMLLLQPALSFARARPVSYSEFKTLVGKGKVSDLVLDHQTIGGSVAVEGLEGLLPKDTVAALRRAGGTTHRFFTVRVDDPGLVAELEQAHVKFEGHVANTWFSTVLSWILPAVVFVACGSSSCGASAPSKD